MSNERHRLLARHRMILERLRIHLEGLAPWSSASAETAIRIECEQQRVRELGGQRGGRANANPRERFPTTGTDG